MKKICLVVLVLMFCVLLCGCTEEERRQAYALEGGLSAFSRQSPSGANWHLSKKAVFSVKELDGEYLNVAKSAVTKANALSSKINIAWTYSGAYVGSDFAFRKSSEKNGANAYTTSSINKYNGEILSSKITFNTYYMNGYPSATKEMLALHEMGHCLGMMDFYTTKDTQEMEKKGILVNGKRNSIVADYNGTIMNGVYTAGRPVFTEYLEFDKRSVQDVYGK